jgi:alkylhydroperoxidase/carboxymuconolactone decarboxylase family protein YurZ
LSKINGASNRSLKQIGSKGEVPSLKIYARHPRRIFNSLAETSGGDLSYFVVNCVYGDLLAEDSILDPKDTALLDFACCYATGAFPQAKGHLYGSLNLGNGRKEIEGIMSLSYAVAQVLGVEMQRKGKEEWAFWTN